MGTGAANDLQFEIFGDKGVIRFNAAEPSWLEIYDARDDSTPLGGMRGFRKLETVQHYEGAKSPDWSMPPGFVRAHAECQYQFLKAIDENRSASPSLADGLHIQAVMEAAEQSSATGGWVTVNDALMHVAQHDIPFGGVGPSGMGHYHGYEGFTTFSKLRPVFYQARFSSLQFLRPPYGEFATRVFNFLVKLKS